MTKLKKISDRDIRSGNVMGPILMIVLFFGLIVMLATIDWRVFIAIIVTGFVCWVWFVGIPRAWNRFVDLVQGDKS